MVLIDDVKVKGAVFKQDLRPSAHLYLAKFAPYEESAHCAARVAKQKKRFDDASLWL